MKIQYLFITLLIVSCATSAPQEPRVESHPEATATKLTNDVHWMRNSAEYKAVVLQTYRLAGERLVELVADRRPGTWAVASDADETIIDNSGYSKELVLAGKESNDEDWDSWVGRRSAPPLPGATEFLELVQRLGGRIAVVTNRSEDHCPDTQANFRAFDIPFDVMMCRRGDRRKESRWGLVEQGDTPADLPPLEIVMWLGDNIRDFPELDQQLRQQGDAAFGAFGDHYFVFPNPNYGSWEENPYD